MTRSNCPSKRRRKDFSNTGGWYKTLGNLVKEIHKNQAKKDREVEIVDDTEIQDDEAKIDDN
jgi:hypothetical protein